MAERTILAEHRCEMFCPFCTYFVLPREYFLVLTLRPICSGFFFHSNEIPADCFPFDATTNRRQCSDVFVRDLKNFRNRIRQIRIQFVADGSSLQKKLDPRGALVGMIVQSV